MSREIGNIKQEDGDAIRGGRMKSTSRSKWHYRKGIGGEEEEHIRKSSCYLFVSILNFDLNADFVESF